ncbi:hypothetical protein ACIA6D_44735 [Streptomyces cacaoi]|uniref:hypothetical protein n=1 Tax=Streptomyces cacaoi TaxID=1898 RepID=UPI003749BF7B
MTNLAAAEADRVPAGPTDAEGSPFDTGGEVMSETDGVGDERSLGSGSSEWGAEGVSDGSTISIVVDAVGCRTSSVTETFHHAAVTARTPTAAAVAAIGERPRVAE